MAIAEMLDGLRGFLSHRQEAYCRTFEGKDAQHVLNDLARFCRANEPTFHTDPRVHAVAEGRREVWLRIQKHLKLTEDQLFDLYAPKGKE